MRKALLLAVVLAVAGCSNGVQNVGGAAAPITASRPASAPSTTKPSAPVLGPKGYGALRLGMSYQDATATGLIKPWRSTGTDSTCSKVTNLKASPDADHGFVYFSTDLGLEIIDAYGPGVRTPEGVHIGSTSEAMYNAYPDFTNAEFGDNHADGRGSTAVPGNSKAVYRMVTASDKVTELTLQYEKQDCYE
jgi:hypothetical protein